LIYGGDDIVNGDAPALEKTHALGGFTFAVCETEQKALEMGRSGEYPHVNCFVAGQENWVELLRQVHRVRSVK
jgi:hypothetical protein